ncbi:DUF763 domain-containing protein [Candidatus Bipolaricaulota bacterium]|nr:DUF763 domain-containing protein [Candidatus Bipolaricaulota bacterium]
MTLLAGFITELIVLEHDVSGLFHAHLRSLIAELAYGAEPSYQDPARFGFAHGGKDGIPYPVDCPLYDETIGLLERAIRKAELGQIDELRALRRMERHFGDRNGVCQQAEIHPEV